MCGQRVVEGKAYTNGYSHNMRTMFNSSSTFNNYQRTKLMVTKSIRAHTKETFIGLHEVNHLQIIFVFNNICPMSNFLDVYSQFNSRIQDFEFMDSRLYVLTLLDLTFFFLDI